jgi:phage terminase small subunit
MMMLCEAADELDYIRKEFKSGRVPRFYLMSNGAEAPHPLMKERKDLLTQSTAWLSQLGFSPADRSRLGLGEVRENNALDELERRRAERNNE